MGDEVKLRRRLPTWLIVLPAVAFVLAMAYWRIAWRMHLLHITAWEAFWL